MMNYGQTGIQIAQRVCTAREIRASGHMRTDCLGCGYNCSRMAPSVYSRCGQSLDTSNFTCRHHQLYHQSSGYGLYPGTSCYRSMATAQTLINSRLNCCFRCNADIRPNIFVLFWIRSSFLSCAESYGSKSIKYSFHRYRKPACPSVMRPASGVLPRVCQIIPASAVLYCAAHKGQTP